MKLTNTQLTAIKEAVTKAEAHTSGEIATALIPESDSYASFELAFAIITGFATFLVLLAFHAPLSLFVQNNLWEFGSFQSALLFGGVPFVTLLASYFLFNVPFFDRLIIPKIAMAQKVNQRARRHFLEAGLTNTKERTGILIFVSELERRVELLADEGIAQKIDQEQWNSIVDTILSGLSNNTFEHSLIEAVNQCGELLTEHFPADSSNPNELDNALVILEN